MQAPCPSCGEDTAGYGPRNLCRDCYLDDETLLDVPDEIQVERCSHCGRVRQGMDWVDAGGDREMIATVLDNKIDTADVTAVAFDRHGQRYHLRLMVEATVDDAVLQQEVETTLVVEQSQCPPCSKFEGGYYEYKIQLRGEHLDEALGRMMDRAAEMTDEDRTNFVSDVTEQDGGYDVYVSSRGMAEALLNVVRQEYDMTEKRSKELVGVEDGERVYRSTVSARIG